MRCHKGFTLVEVTLSVAIMLILAAITLGSLNQSKKGEEIKTSANQLAADLRSMQSRAFSAGEIRTCLLASNNRRIVCEEPSAICVTDCKGEVPSSYGVNMVRDKATYELFAELTVPNFIYDDGGELLNERSLLTGNPNVYIEKIMTGDEESVPRASVVFMRQNGNTRIDIGTGVEPNYLNIYLKHRNSEESTAVIEINRITGRISVY